MYGYLALDKDLNTVKGIIFYEHGETPGLGGEIENPRWCQLWVGRKVYDSTGEVKLSVIKGGRTSRFRPTSGRWTFRCDHDKSR